MSKINTPFDYNAGINYESWTMGRTDMNIATDLAFVGTYFKLIKTFHCAAVGSSDPMNPIIDSTQQAVINAVKSNGMQLIMGTNNSALAEGGYGCSWEAGLMMSSAYTDKWVEMIITAFGGDTATVLTHLKTICLGNEIDANGPPPSDPSFASYAGWIEAAFNNLSASLGAKGLGPIPITSIIANYPLGDPSSNTIASGITRYINDHWQSGWNHGHSFVLFNQYTPDFGKSTDFIAVISYFDQVAQKLGGSPQVFVGETGYSAEYGLSNEALVVNDVFSWLKGQQSRGSGEKNTPVCLFQAFNHPAKPDGQKQMGLFEYVDGVPQVKPGITISGWNQPIPDLGRC